MLKKLNFANNHGGQEGFTLIEVLMAMVILSIGLIGLAMMQGVAIQGNMKGNMYSQATFVAQDMIENLKEGSIGTFGQVDIVASPAGTILDTGPTELVDENSIVGTGPYTRDWTVFSHTEWARLVSVTVSWTDPSDAPGSPARTVTLSTVTRGGL